MSESAFSTFQQAWEQARRRYWTLPPRDRWILNSLAGLFVVVFVWLALIVPAERIRAQALAELSARQGVLQWMKDNEGRAKEASKLSVSVERKSGQALMAAVTQSSTEHGISLKRYEPEGDDKLRLWLDAQSFNSMMRWMDVLTRQHGMSVVNISVDASGAPGVVNARIVLRG